MQIIVGGVRGTGPVSRVDALEYGGDTTAILVKGAQRSLLVDAGSGVRALLPELPGNTPGACSLQVFFTHYHLDHVVGLPSLPLFYQKDCAVDIAAPIRGGVRAEHIVRALFSSPLWPVHFDELPSRVTFTDLPEQGFDAPLACGDLVLRWCPVSHPDHCSAVRVDEPATGAAMVFATDIEWQKSTPEQKAWFLRLCREPQPADLLFFDAHFTPEEYPGFVNWGHSTWRDAIEVARASGVKRLGLIHHAPEKTDKELRGIEETARREWPDVFCAKAGAVFNLGK